MTTKTLAILGSNSTHSINKQLMNSILQFSEANDIDKMDSQNIDLPIFSIDIEKNEGFPETLRNFHREINAYNNYLIVANEHNRTVSAFFKNMLDWISRIDFDTFKDKNILIITASPGRMGGKGANDYLQTYFKMMRAKRITSVTFPSFNDNFDMENGQILLPDLEKQIKEALLTFRSDA
ncbi:MAG TPA: NADPH-dependent FMN reductase [Flavobacterium sp.]|nr:NADPH-dependent FMN reductase [Flavobacterium sp.]